MSLVAFFLYTIVAGNTTGYWHERYFVVGIPVAIISLVLILTRVTSNFDIGRNFSILLVTLSFAASFQAAANIPLKEDYRGASAWIASNYDANSVVVMGWKPNEAYYRHYLDRDSRLKNRLVNFETVSFEDDVARLCTKYGNVAATFVLIQHSGQLPYFDYLSDCRTLKEVERIDFQGITVSKFVSSKDLN